eukprot:scaffold17184_cov150-Skeletonema_marinoi.AAC.2
MLLSCKYVAEGRSNGSAASTTRPAEKIQVHRYNSTKVLAQRAQLISKSHGRILLSLTQLLATCNLVSHLQIFRIILWGHNCGACCDPKRAGKVEPQPRLTSNVESVLK